MACIALAACNHKAEIVELQKKAKDSARIYKMYMDGLEAQMRSHPDTSETPTDVEYRRCFGQMRFFEQQYDSLEMELKKY